MEKEIKIIFKIDSLGQAATIISKQGVDNSPEDKLLLLGLLEHLKFIECTNLTNNGAKITKRFDNNGLEI